MKKINNFFLLLLFVIFSCTNGSIKDELTIRVRNDINTEFSKRSSENNISYSMTSFDLIHVEGNKYSGLLETIENGNVFQYKVSVTSDGDSYLWEIVE